MIICMCIIRSYDKSYNCCLTMLLYLLECLMLPFRWDKIYELNHRLLHPHLHMATWSRADGSKLCASPQQGQPGSLRRRHQGTAQKGQWTRHMPEHDAEVSYYIYKYNIYIYIYNQILLL
jgi:hypothetical protein